MIDFAKDNHITHIVMGTPPDTSIKAKDLSIGLQLQTALPDVKFITL